MQPTNPPVVPRWQDVRAACDGLQQAMDAMIDQPEFESFRPSVARAIALARDEKQRADHPAPAAPVMVKDGAHDRLEAIAVTLSPSDVARIVLAARA
jgi:hypothetical protein